MRTYTIHYQPDQVPVSDDREWVDGVYVSIETPEMREVASGLIIPPEGLDRSCWLGDDFDAFLDSLGEYESEMVDELAYVANTGHRAIQAATHRTEVYCDR